MKLHSDAVTAQTGLRYDSAAKAFFGSLGRFPAVLRQLPRQNAVLLQIAGTIPDAAQVNEQLRAWQEENPCVLSAEYRNRRIGCAFIIPKKQPDETVCGLASAVTMLAADLGMRPCCMSCGTESAYELYFLDKNGVTVCPECRAELAEKLAAEQEKHAQEKPKYAGIVLGALLGALLVFGMTWFVMRQSRISVLTAYAGMVLGFLLMKKLGKKVTLPAALFCAVLCLLGSFSGIWLHSAQSLAAKNRDMISLLDVMHDDPDFQPFELTGGAKRAHDMLFGDMESLKLASEITDGHIRMFYENPSAGKCLLHLPALCRIPIYRAEGREILMDMLFGFLSVAAGTAMSIYPILRGRKTAYLLRKPVAA